MLIRSFVNTLANSFGGYEWIPGRNAIGASSIIIERLPPSCQVVSGLYRLRGVFLTKLGADEAQIEEAFCRAIRTAKEQKSISWTKRAEATYAEYRRQKARATRGGGFQLPIC
jgi:hypothetical protein